jgi:hypothetical protein
MNNIDKNNDKNRIIPEHIEEKIIVDYSIVPSHESRENLEEVSEFEKAKRQMKKDGFTKCFICGCESIPENHIEYHHFLAEDCFSNDVDMDKLWELAKLFDIYGYASKSIQPPKTVNDPMNLMPLCHNHHTGSEGIHSNSFPTFIIQRLLKSDLLPKDNPVPEDDNELKELKKEFKDKEHIK